MPLSKEKVLEVYGMCQQTVVQESDSSLATKEYKTCYVEFLELIARVANSLFEGSEMEGEDKIAKKALTTDTNQTKMVTKSCLEKKSFQ